MCPVFNPQDPYMPRARRGSGMNVNMCLRTRRGSETPTRTRLISPASAESLIFFCLLFLYQDKAPTGAGKFFSVHFQDQSCTRPVSPASAEALIFFCLLFLYQDKAPTGAGKFFSVHFQDRSHIYLYSSIHFPTLTRTRLTSSASAEALIFFCLLFLYQDKKRR